VLSLIQNEQVKAAHDCSKGGLAVAACELAITGDIGCEITLENVPSESLLVDRLLFSESHSRYLLVVEKQKLGSVVKYLEKNKVDFGLIGKFGANQIVFSENKKQVAKLRVDKSRDKWFNSLGDLVLHG
jgi:phosphoribosylformylglycinamidine synthase